MCETAVGGVVGFLVLLRFGMGKKGCWSAINGYFRLVFALSRPRGKFS